jgi:hypothetical protein
MICEPVSLPASGYLCKFCVSIYIFISSNLCSMKSSFSGKKICYSFWHWVLYLTISSRDSNLWFPINTKTTHLGDLVNPRKFKHFNQVLFHMMRWKNNEKCFSHRSYVKHENTIIHFRVISLWPSLLSSECSDSVLVYGKIS